MEEVGYDARARAEPHVPSLPDADDVWGRALPAKCDTKGQV